MMMNLLNGLKLLMDKTQKKLKDIGLKAKADLDKARDDCDPIAEARAAGVFEGMQLIMDLFLEESLEEQAELREKQKNLEATIAGLNKKKDNLL